MSESFVANAESAGEIIKSDTINGFAPAAQCPAGTVDFGGCTTDDNKSWSYHSFCMLGKKKCNCNSSMTTGNYGWKCKPINSVEVDVVRSPYVWYILPEIFPCN